MEVSYRLKWCGSPRGRRLRRTLPRNEVVIVPLVGPGRLSFNGKTHVLVRNDLFRELADIVYLPPRTKYVWKRWGHSSLQLAAPQPKDDFRRESFGKRR